MSTSSTTPRTLPNFRTRAAASSTVACTLWSRGMSTEVTMSVPNSWLATAAMLEAVLSPWAKLFSPGWSLTPNSASSRGARRLTAAYSAGH